MKNRGFTLIELLVVIAIIGILSSVVLASLNSARDKGHDASAKASMNNIRAAAEVIYDDASPVSYDTVCNAGNDVATLIAAAQAETGTTASCTDSATVYAVSIQLRNSDFFCVDSTGVARTQAAAQSGGSC